MINRYIDQKTNSIFLNYIWDCEVTTIYYLSDGLKARFGNYKGAKKLPGEDMSCVCVFGIHHFEIGYREFKSQIINHAINTDFAHFRKKKLKPVESPPPSPDILEAPLPRHIRKPPSPDILKSPPPDILYML